MIVLGKLLDLARFRADRIRYARADRRRGVVDEVGPGVRLHGVPNREKPHALGRGCRAGAAADVEDYVPGRIAVGAEGDTARLRVALERAERDALRVLVH